MTALAGCDLLTISPKLLAELESNWLLMASKFLPEKVLEMTVF